VSAAKKIILLLWFIVASLASASALTPGATETRVGQKSFAPLETRQAEPLQTPGLHQENTSCGYELAPESLLAGDAAFRSLPLRDQFLSDAGQMARPDAQFQTISHLDPVARGTALTGGGWMAPVNAVRNFNPAQVLNLMGTGPAAAVRIYAPGGAMLTSGGVNVVNTVTMALPHNGGGR